MSQNMLIKSHQAGHLLSTKPHLHRVDRNQVENALEEIAYVLHLTRRVQADIQKSGERGTVSVLSQS